MEIIKLLCDMFNKKSIPYDIEKFLKEERILFNNDEKFFKYIIQYFGGRGYNEFLDYGLLALKLTNIFEGEYTLNEDGESVVVCMTECLLHDDRHDLWQNLPYHIDDLEDPYKWKLSADALLECINLDGTGDITFKQKLIQDY